MPDNVQSVERAAAILRLLAAGARSLGEISEALELKKPTAHGLLRTLRDVGFVDQDRTTGHYRLASGLLRIGDARVDVNELRSRAINWADALAARSGESVRIGSRVAGRVLVVHHVFRPDDSAQKVDVGTLLPLHASALGKAILASDPVAVAALKRTELTAFTRTTVVAPQALNRALAAVRDSGWAAEVEELRVGEAAIGAPIRGQGGLVVGSIGLSGPVDRVCDARRTPRAGLVAQVTDAARAVSRELGARA